MGLGFLHQVDNNQIKRIRSSKAIKLELETNLVFKSKENTWEPSFFIPLGHLKGNFRK